MRILFELLTLKFIEAKRNGKGHTYEKWQELGYQVK